MKKRKFNLLKIISILLNSAMFTAIAHFGLLYQVDNALNDMLYQRPTATDTAGKTIDGKDDVDVVVLGLTEETEEDLRLDDNFLRKEVLRVIKVLNSDPNNRPAAIGVDVLFLGESDDPKLDKEFAKTCEKYGNVVVACAATFNEQMKVDDDGNFYMEDYTVTRFDEPYDMLNSTATKGHINAMYDEDGVLRHGILSIGLEDIGRDERVNSFSYNIYKKYAKKNNLPTELENIIPRDELERFYVNYTKSPKFEQNKNVAVSNVTSLEEFQTATKDNVFIIGPYAKAFRDDFKTAIDYSRNMYGVEYQANIVWMMIQGKFKAEASNNIQLIGLFLVTAACAWIFWESGIRRGTIIWLSVSGLYLIFAIAIYEKGIVLHSLWIPLSITISYIILVGVNYFREMLEKRKVTNAFKRYLAPDVVNELLKEGVDNIGLSGKLCNISVLFVDIRGFTPMSESLPPEEVVSILNKYLNLTSECIMKHGGTLDKFIGDATMAFFGAPLPQEDHAYKAVLSALDMVQGSAELSKELMEKFGKTVEFGIGINVGDAVVGNIGAERRMDYTAIGDVVNTAARLESNAPGGKVYISKAVVDVLGDRIEVESLGDSIKLKGKAEGFEVFELKGLSKK